MTSKLRYFEAVIDSIAEPVNILSCINDCIGGMTTSNALAKVCFTKYFHNTNIAGLDEFFIHRKFLPTCIRYIAHSRYGGWTMVANKNGLFRTLMGCTKWFEA